MPLPFAPPPKDSKVYADLGNTKVSNVEVGSLDSLKSNLYAQGKNGSEDEMRRLLLLGQVSNQSSMSGPIPGTAQIVTGSIDTSGDQVIPFTAGAGEIWEFQGIDAERAGSGQILYQLYLTDSVNGTEVYFYYMKSSDSNVLFFADAESGYFNSPLYLDENVSLKCEASDSGGTLTSVTFSIAVVRVR